MHLKLKCGVRVYVKFKSDNSRGVVVAIAEDCRGIAIGAANRKIRMFAPVLPIWNSAFHERVLMEDTYKGIARCHPNEKFNLEEGKRVALEKLKEKLDNAVAKRLICFAGELSRASRDILY